MRTPRRETKRIAPLAMTRPRSRKVLSLLLIVLMCSQTLAYNRTSAIIDQIFGLSALEPVKENVTVCSANQCPLLAADRRWPDFSDHGLLRTMGCFCDESCAMFDDCCPDAAPRPAAVPAKTASCSYLPDLGSYLYMVPQCPTSWPHDTTLQACQSKSASLYEDPLAALLVTNPLSGWTYRNAACARCHGDTDDAVLWSAAVTCPGVMPNQAKNVTAQALRRNQNGEWGIVVAEDGMETFKVCEFSLKLPRRLQKKYVRGCLPAVSRCAPDWTDDEVAAECGAYTARVQDENGTSEHAEESRHVYRNLHCALCNGVPLDALRCGGLGRLGRAGVSYNTPGDYPPKAFSFSILLDISDRSGSEEVGAVEVCDGARLWDPFFHKCRQVFCNAGQVLEGETCIPKTNTSSGNSSSESSQFRLCPKFYLSADEYETRSDGTVYVRLYDRLYVDGEFELRDGELAVCSQSGDLGKFDETLGYLSLVCVAASIICLCCHLVLFCLVSEQRNLPGKNLAALCVCLLLGYVCFLSAPFQEADTSGCRALGIIMYTAFIASFLWMNVMAFDVFISLKRAVSELRVVAGDRLKPFLFYFLYVLSITVSLVTAAIITDTTHGGADTYRPGFGERVCWFSRRRALMVFFAVPLMIIMVLNALMFAGSALIVRQAARSAASITCGPSKTNLKLYSRLAVMTGLSWVLGLAASWADFPPLWHVFVVFNALQGVFIFISFTMGDRLRGQVRRRMSRLARWQAGGGRSGPDTSSDGEPPQPPTGETQI